MNKILIATAAIFATAACAGPTPYVNDRAEPKAWIRVWIENDPLLEGASVLKGCNLWLPKEVGCVLERVKAKADVRITADHGPCVPDEKKQLLVAFAYRGGNIVFKEKCFKRFEGVYRMEVFEDVVGHEIGHQLGIWEHVSKTCGKDVKKDPAGRRICGPALMNPVHDRSIRFITVPDSLAFDIRDREHSVLRERTEAALEAPEDPLADEPDCRYYDDLSR